MDGITTSIVAGGMMNTTQPAPGERKEKKKTGDDIRRVNRRTENKF